MCDGGAICFGAFLRTCFGYCEDHGKCAVATDLLELFLVFEMVGEIVCRCSVCVGISVLYSRWFDLKSCELLM